MKRILNIVLLFSLAILLLLYRANAQDVCENNYECGGTLFKYNISTVAKFDLNPLSVVYKNGTIYVGVSTDIYSIKNETLSKVTTLSCSLYGQMIFDKYDNLVFKCYSDSNVPNVYSYSLETGSLVKISSFTSKRGDFSFTYDPETETYYYVTADGFCTSGSTTCDTGLVKSNSLTYYNGYIYNLYPRYSDRKITRWEKNKPFSSVEYMILPDGNGIKFNSRGEMFVYTSTEIVKYVDGGKFTIFGGSSSGYSGDGSVSTNALADGISSLAFDEFGNIFFADYYNRALRKMTVVGCMDLPYVNSTTCQATCSNVPLADPNVCSGYGKCDISSGSNSTCICAEGYSGIDCETPICFGVKASDPNVCGKNGTCTSKDTCECYDGASGLNCQDFICFNVSGASPNVCSDYGEQVKCIGADVCEHTCFGIGASSPNVCSGEGVCISENNCSCSFGRNGSECEISQTCSIPNCDGECVYMKEKETCLFQCYGIDNINSTVCSGRGNCTAENTCSCKSPYYGTNCLQRHNTCFGIVETNSLVCSGRGNCTAENTCTCVEGFNGTKCEQCIDPTKCGGSFFSYRIDKVAFSFKTDPTSGDPLNVKLISASSAVKTSTSTYIVDADANNGLIIITNGNLNRATCPNCNLLAVSKNQVYASSTALTSKIYTTTNYCASCASIFKAASVSITALSSNIFSTSIFIFTSTNKIYTFTEADSTSTLYAGTGVCGTSIASIEDKAPLSAQICATNLVTTLGDEVYFVNFNTIFKITKDATGNNIVRRVACNSSATDEGLDGLAVNSKCSNITQLFTSQDRSKILFSTSSGLIRSISSQDGILRAYQLSIPVGSTSITPSYSENEYLFINNNFVKSYNETSNSISVIAGVGDVQAAILATAAYLRGIAYNNGTIYVAEGYIGDTRLRAIKNGLISTLVTLTCYIVDGSLLTDKNGDLVFACSVSSIYNLYRYSLSTKSITKLTSVTTYDSIYSLTYNPTTDTLYYIASNSGFCTFTSSLTRTCEASVTSGKVEYYNGYIYHLSGSGLKSWDATKSLSTATVISSTSLGSGNFKINSKGEIFTFYANNVINRYIKDTQWVIAGTYGSAGSSGDGGLALSALVTTPSGMIFDENGVIYFIDETLATLRKLTPVGCMSSSLVNPTTCDIYCNGIMSSNENVCTGGGICSVVKGTSYSVFNPELGKSTTVTPESTSCSCLPGYTGSECQFKNCFGRNSSDPKACNGNGTCIRTDKCACFDGYEGSSCLYYTCSGISSTSMLGCAKYGTDVKCIGPNTCEHTCNGVGASSSNVCSGEGKCKSADKCSCNYGRYGSNCELSQPCVNINCTETAKCLYLNSTEVCTFTCFDLLSTKSMVCSGRGSCIDNNNCSCSQGWMGSNCSQPHCNNLLPSDSNVCSGNGYCFTNVTTPYCSCKKGYFGANCDDHSCSNVASKLSNTCSGHGTCIAMDQCSCKEGWFGINCDVTTCGGVWSNSSQACGGLKCIAPNTCEVLPTYWPVHTSYTNYVSKWSFDTGNTIIDMAYVNGVYYVLFDNEIVSFVNGVKKSILTSSDTLYNMAVGKTGRYLYYSRKRYVGTYASYIYKYDMVTKTQIGSRFEFVQTISMTLNDDDSKIYFVGRSSGEGTVGYGSVDITGLFDGNNNNYGAVTYSAAGAKVAVYNELVYVAYTKTTSIYSGTKVTTTYATDAYVSDMKVTKNGRTYIAAGTNIYLYVNGISTIPYSIFASSGSTPTALALKDNSILYSVGTNIYELSPSGFCGFGFGFGFG